MRDDLVHLQRRSFPADLFAGRGMQMGVYHVFVYLQLLDLLTTLVGFRLGAGEASPFIRILMLADPVAGVVLSKVLALGLGGMCLWTNRTRVIRWITYWYGALIVWNLSVMLAASR
jgi:hypothetical protein